MVNWSAGMVGNEENINVREAIEIDTTAETAQNEDSRGRTEMKDCDKLGHCSGLSAPRL